MPYKDADDEKRYQADWYQRNREVTIARAKRRREANRARLKEIVREAKSVPCADCGRVYPYYCMDFDHLGDKVCNVSESIRRDWTEARLRKEMAKCEVVCAICHRIRTHERLVQAGVSGVLLEGTLA